MDAGTLLVLVLGAVTLIDAAHRSPSARVGRPTSGTLEGLRALEREPDHEDRLLPARPARSAGALRHISFRVD